MLHIFILVCNYRGAPFYPLYKVQLKICLQLPIGTHLSCKVEFSIMKTFNFTNSHIHTFLMKQSFWKISPVSHHADVVIFFTVRIIIVAFIFQYVYNSSYHDTSLEISLQAIYLVTLEQGCDGNCGRTACTIDLGIHRDIRTLEQ